MSTEEEIRGHAAKAAVYAELATMGSGAQVELAAKAREEAEAAVALGKKDPAAYDQAMKGSGDPQGFKKELETVADKDFNITNTYKPGLDEHASQELNKLGGFRSAASKEDLAQVSHELAEKAAHVPTRETVAKGNAQGDSGVWGLGGDKSAEYKSGSKKSYELASAAVALARMSGGDPEKSNDHVLQAAVEYKKTYEHERSRFKDEKAWENATSAERGMENADYKLANAIGGKTPVHGDVQVSRQEFERYMPENGRPNGAPGLASGVIESMSTGSYGVKGDLDGIVAKYPDAAQLALSNERKSGNKEAEQRIQEAIDRSQDRVPAQHTVEHAKTTPPKHEDHLVASAQRHVPQETAPAAGDHHTLPAEKKIVAQSQESPPVPGKGKEEPFTELSQRDNQTLQAIADELGVFNKKGGTTPPIMDEKAAYAALGKLASSLESANLGELPKQILQTVENFATQKSRG